MTILKYTLSAFLLVLLLAFYLVYVDTNLHEVEKGAFYRSAQLNKKEFKEVIETYDIKTIINLRDISDDKEWFNDERAVADEHGVTHISIGMSARRIPHRYEVKALLEAYQELEKPILVHCRNGADRSGIADALYRMEVLGQDAEEAREALSWKHLHFPFMRPQPSYFLDLYQSRQHFEEAYYPCRNEFAYFIKKKYCSNTGEPLARVLNSPEYVHLVEGPLRLSN